MGYYENLCASLRPLGVYALGEESVSGAELWAAGTALDTLSARLAEVERESVLATAETEGLARHLALLHRRGVGSVSDRRASIAALERIRGDSFTPEAIACTLAGCGIAAACSETGQPGAVSVSFPGVVGVPDGFDAIRRAVLEILPCHLAVTFAFRFLTWGECEANGYTWAQVGAYSWEEFEKAI